MGFVWNPWALPNLVAAVLIILIAFFLLHVGSGRTTNRLLAVVLLFHGFTWDWVGLLYSQTEPSAVFAAQVMVAVSFVPGLALYPTFLGHALDRAPAFLRSRAWITGSGVGAATLVASMVVRPEWVVAGIIEVPFATYDAVPGPLMVVMLALALVVSLVGLTLSIYEIVGTLPGTPQRQRARSFLLAFGIQDILLGGGAAVVAFMDAGDWLYTFTNIAAGAIGSLAASVLVSYGIIRHQLFDVEVHMRFAISRSTMAAAFVAMFFITSEGAQILFGQRSQWFGLLASGALVFALTPLQRMAERLAEKAVPKHKAGPVAPDGDDPEDVFRQALRLALRDTRLSREEEGHLFRLARSLHIDAARAHELLADVEREQARP